MLVSTGLHAHPGTDPPAVAVLGGSGLPIGQPYDLEKGAGAMNPLIFFDARGPKP